MTKTYTAPASISEQDLVELLLKIETDDLARILAAVARIYEPCPTHLRDLGESVAVLPPKDGDTLSRFCRSLSQSIDADPRGFRGGS